MIKALIFFMLATLFFLRRFYIQLRNITKRRSKHRGKRQFHLAKSAIALTVLLGLITSASAAGLVINCIGYRHALTDVAASSEPRPSSEVEAMDQLPYHTSTPVSDAKDIPVPFQLTDVKDSAMINLADILICGGTIDGKLLDTYANRFEAFLAPYCYPSTFFPFYEGLESHFPDGEEVVYAFDDVVSLENCNAQLRGAGERLKNSKGKNQAGNIEYYTHHLSIRAGDALRFTKYNYTESPWQRESIWLYSEIDFSALMNEYIFSHPKGLALSDWYYRLAQVYDYLGGIANTDELELKMYVVSAVLLRCAFEVLVKQGIAIYEGAYDYEIWDLYITMLCRVGVRVENEMSSGFFSEIYRIETTVMDQPLPASIISTTKEKLNYLQPYQEWREQFE